MKVRELKPLLYYKAKVDIYRSKTEDKEGINVRRIAPDEIPEELLDLDIHFVSTTITADSDTAYATIEIFVN